MKKNARMLGLIRAAMITMLFFSCKEENNSRPYWVNFFNENEDKFESLYSYYDTIRPSIKEAMVTFYNNDNDTLFDISVYPLNGAINSENPVLGGKNLNIHSKKLDIAIKKINWTTQDLFVLKERLKLTGCKWIRATESQGNPVQIYIKEKGLGSFSYFIYKKPLSDSLLKIKDNTPSLNTQKLRDRVFLEFSSAL